MPHLVHVGRSGYPVPVAVSGPVISVNVSRYTGVAPLAVFFDASGTTDYTTLNPYHDLGYEWDFGDPGSGPWGTTGFSQNTAFGPEAVHVYRDPALAYTVTLTVTNGDTVAVAQYTIGPVTDPEVVYAGALTTAVGATTLPVAGVDGVPAGATCVTQSDWPTIIIAYATDNRRVLLKHDDTFTGAANTAFNNSGVMIGMYGTGAKPRIRTTGTANNSHILSAANQTASDCILMDLDIDGQSDVHRDFFVASGTHHLSQLLFFRLDIHDLGGGFSVTAGSIAVPDQIFIIECTVEHIKSTSGSAASEGIFLFASQLGILGNTLDDTLDVTGAAEHLLRLGYVDRGVVSHNVISNVHSGKEMIALRAPNSALGNPPYPSSSPKTAFVVVSYNNIEVNTYQGIQTDTEGVAGQVAIIEDVIIESNFFTRTTTGQALTRTRAKRVSLRNNVADSTVGTNTVNPFEIRGDGVLNVAASDVWVYNNSTYSGGTQTARIVRIEGVNVTGLVVRNNILYKPNGAAPVAVSDSNPGSNSYVESNDLLTDPSFVVDPPVVAEDFALDVGSPAIDAGYPVPVLYDYNGDSRPSGVANDQGAFET